MIGFLLNLFYRVVIFSFLFIISFGVTFAPSNKGNGNTTLVKKSSPISSPSPSPSETPTITSKNANPESSVALIHCLGPDGKYSYVTQNVCDSVNDFWKGVTAVSSSGSGGGSSSSSSSSTPTLKTANFFPFGMLDDGSILSDSDDYSSDIADMQSHHLDTVLFTNNNASTQSDVLDSADAAGFNVVFAPMIGPDVSYWDDSITGSLDLARQVFQPIANELSSHPSLLGYNIRDDDSLADKTAWVTQAIHEVDQTHAVIPVEVTNNEDVYLASPQPDVFLSYDYDVTSGDPCNLSYSNGTGANNLVESIRVRNSFKNMNTPFWEILQGKYNSGNSSPTAQDISLETWLSIGEGAKGIFYFTYKSEQNWTGVVDNSAVYDEISTLAQRIDPLKPTLLKLRKSHQEYFTASSQNSLSYPHLPYVSTLVSSTNPDDYYVILANESCSPQSLAVSTTSFSGGELKDVETGNTYNFGSWINLNGGDGKLFEVVNATTFPTAPTTPNLLSNSSFETNDGSSITDWFLPISYLDSTQSHTGTYSLKIDPSLSGQYINQNITLEPDTMYTYSFWAKADNAVGTGVTVRYPVLTPSVVIESSPIAVTGTTNGWVEEYKTFFTPLNITSGRFDIYIPSLTSGTVWVDDVDLCKGWDCNL